MNKPLVLISEGKTVFYSNVLEEILGEYFTIEVIDKNKKYPLKNTVVVSDWIAFDHKTNLLELEIASTGIPHVIDHCWDSWDTKLNFSSDFIIRPKHFIRFNESIWYTKLGYNSLALDSNPTKDFLCLINKELPWKKKFFDRLRPLCQNNIYSFNGIGIPLTNAKDIDVTNNIWQRYNNTHWYRDTRFSIVVESEDYINWPKSWKNVSEKTYKPMAFKHPFVVWGPPGILADIKEQGFRTFDHCIDESYDSIEDRPKRLDALMSLINYIVENKEIFKDPLTQEILEHNYNLFYDQDICLQLLREELVNPLLEFIESRK